MVKEMIQRLVKKVQQIKELYTQLNRQIDTQMLKGIEYYIKKLNDKLRHSFLKEVQPLDRRMENSLVMQMSPTYAKFYRLYLTLQKGLSLSTDVFKISNKNVAELYEYWCFIKLSGSARI